MPGQVHLTHTADAEQPHHGGVAGKRLTLGHRHGPDPIDRGTPGGGRSAPAPGRAVLSDALISAGQRSAGGTGVVVGRLSNAFSSGARLRSLGFQSKLLLMLLTVSVLSVLVAGVIGYLSGTSSIRNAEYQRLTQLRESRARAITDGLKSITDSAAILTHSGTTVNAVREFSTAFAELQRRRCRRAPGRRSPSTTRRCSAPNWRRGPEEGRSRVVPTDLERADVPAGPLHGSGSGRLREVGQDPVGRRSQRVVGA